MVRFRSWPVSHSGAVRDHNEDAFVDRPDIGLWAVADGAGGHQRGELASSTIKAGLERIPAGLTGLELVGQVRQAVAEAHESLVAEASRSGPGTMIASTVAVLLAYQDHFACLWAGDSRIYLLRDGSMRQLTRDHSLVQDLVDAGVVRPEDADSHPRANVITRAVGAEGDAFALEKVTDRILPGDRFLLCSDGLFKALPQQEVAVLLDGAGETPAQVLIDAALRARATDNVTAVVVDALGEANGDDPGQA